VDGIIISNHGGRQLDTTPATIDILREVAPTAKGKIHLALDGGVYRGSDIFKAIALGADFVFGGRLAIWGLAVRPFIISPLFMEEDMIYFLCNVVFSI
jgi:(S)-2-hydroxy-acid oxidase